MYVYLINEFYFVLFLIILITFKYNTVFIVQRSMSMCLFNYIHTTVQAYLSMYMYERPSVLPFWCYKLWLVIIIIILLKIL